MNKITLNNFNKIKSFFKELNFFDDMFLKWLENKISFSRNVDLCGVLKNEIILPYPNSVDNYINCIDIICDAYRLYLKRKKQIVDDFYLNTLKESIKRIYITENANDYYNLKYNKNISKNIDNYKKEELVGIALSFLISEEYESVRIFLVPDKYYFDKDAAKEKIKFELTYNYNIK